MGTPAPPACLPHSLSNAMRCYLLRARSGPAGLSHPRVAVIRVRRSQGTPKLCHGPPGRRRARTEADQRVPRAAAPAALALPAPAGREPPRLRDGRGAPETRGGGGGLALAAAGPGALARAPTLQLPDLLPGAACRGSAGHRGVIVCLCSMAFEPCQAYSTAIISHNPYIISHPLCSRQRRSITMTDAAREQAGTPLSSSGRGRRRRRRRRRSASAAARPRTRRRAAARRPRPARRA